LVVATPEAVSIWRKEVRINQDLAGHLHWSWTQNETFLKGLMMDTLEFGEMVRKAIELAIGDTCEPKMYQIRAHVDADNMLTIHLEYIVDLEFDPDE
jgi:hypothetical protein